MDNKQARYLHRMLDRLAEGKNLSPEEIALLRKELPELPIQRPWKRYPGMYILRGVRLLATTGKRSCSEILRRGCQNSTTSYALT